MSEGLRTAVFAGVALALGVVAYVSQPKPEPPVAPGQVGKVLFEEFDDPAKAASLEIVRYDEELDEFHDFEVARNKSGMWSIPSHADYPADADDQMKQAALCLVGLKVLGLVTEDRNEHELFGVVEPDRDQLKLGNKGVGLLVRFQDDKGNKLAGLVVGKPIKNSEQQRFVRVPGQDPVYAVEFDPDQLSTKFEDWIEDDLLKLNTFDVERVTVKDYSLVPTSGGGLLPEKRFDATVTYNSTDAKWELDDLVTYRRQEGSLTQFDATPTDLLETEELNSTKLNDFKTALGDLKIVDVRRKPGGVSAELTAEEDFLSDQETLRSLASLGFYPVDPDKDGRIELLSANGEVHVLMKDGYEYVLRFGNVARSDEGVGEDGTNRYLFVMTRVDYSKFPQPQLEDMPQGPSPEAAPAPGCQDEQENQGQQQAGGDETAAAGADSGETQPEEEDKSATTGDQPPAAPAASDEEEAERKLAAERERVTKENQRKLDEWNDNKQKAEEKVRELNARFADWYYIISEDVYKKIRLSRSDLVQESETAKEEGFGVDAFRSLQDKGLEDEAP